MKVVVTIATIDARHGGPARTVPDLCRALARSNVDVEIITVAEHGHAIQIANADEFSVKTISTNADRYHPHSWRKAFEDSLIKAVEKQKNTVIYDVGLWLPSNHFAAKVARKTRTPWIASPRGMLSSSALAVRKWKKQLAWVLYQRRDLRSATVLHATAQSEGKDFRRKGLSQPIAVVPHGVEVPEIILDLPAREHRRTVLFLSRLHPIKGLMQLVHAWARLSKNDWRVIIAGNDEGEHLAHVRAEINRLNLNNHFEFIGAVETQKKWELMHAANLFVLPSHSESFGLVVAEALACGVPVIASRGTPWQDLITHRCGWWVDNDPESLANALREAMSVSEEERCAMGQRGQKLVEANYSWPKVASQMCTVFEWMLGAASKPDCVFLDAK